MKLDISKWQLVSVNDDSYCPRPQASGRTPESQRPHLQMKREDASPEGHAGLTELKQEQQG